MTAQEPQRTWRPNSAPQEQFLTYGGFEGGYGGAAGGGKSEALLVDALYGIEHSSYRAILFRRTFDELKKSLIDRARDFYPHLGGVEHKTDHVWTFPGGAQVGFSHMAELTDYKRFDSAEFQFVGFDELTSFHREQYIFMASRLRSSKGLRSRLRWATNPGGVGHAWVFARFAPWLDTRPEYDGYRADFGEVLYFARDEADPDGDGRVVPKGTPGALPRTFVRALATDNPDVGAEYLAQLDILDRVTRAQKKLGDWLIKPGKGLYFQRPWWRFLDVAPPSSAWRKAVRAWDLAATADGDWTVGVLTAHVPTALQPWVIMDVVRFRGTPAEVRAKVLAAAKADGPEVTILIPQDPGQAGVDQRDAYARLLAGYTLRTHRPTGSKVVRASGHSSQVEHAQVALVRGPWNEPFVGEHQDFPMKGVPDDQVDAGADAINYLSGRVATSDCAALFADFQQSALRRESSGIWRPPPSSDEDEDADASSLFSSRRE
jgi:predicted phage terminase large subunit-like protein